MPDLVCKRCDKQFYSKHSVAKYCTRKCSDKETNRTRKRNLAQAARRAKEKFPYKVNEKGFYIEHKEEFQDKIITYENAPNGKAYIGINKTPLMANANGIGYQGVLLQDDTRQFVQCSGCGKWLKIITNLHLKKCHGKPRNVQEYKKEFGLYPAMGLVSDETSLKYTESALKVLDNLTRTVKKAFNKSRTKKFRLKADKVNELVHKSMSWKNAHGSCPEQIKARVKEFILQNRELPGSTNRGSILYKILTRQFGTCSNGFKYLGLPYRERTGTNLKFTFPDYTVYKINLNQMYDREMLFNLMKEKCTLLQS